MPFELLGARVSAGKQKQPVSLQTALQIDLDFQLTTEAGVDVPLVDLQVRYIADIASANQTLVLPHTYTLITMAKDTTDTLRETTERVDSDAALQLVKDTIYRLRWALADPSALLLPAVEERYLTQVGVLQFQLRAQEEEGSERVVAQAQFVSETKKASNGKLFWSLYSPFDV